MADVNCRKFLKVASAGGAAAAAATVASPAIAQSAPELKWRLTSSFPKSLDTLYGGAEIFAKVGRRSDRQQVPDPGASRPARSCPACRRPTPSPTARVEMCHTASVLLLGQGPDVRASARPFRSVSTARMQNAWMYEGGGIDLMNAFYAKHKIFGLPAGNTGAQMGGWYRKEINTPDDLKGLKMRIGGFAGAVIAKLGAVPQQIAGGDIYPALEKGTIDAASGSGPTTTRSSASTRSPSTTTTRDGGKAAPCSTSSLNMEKWNELPKNYQAIRAGAAADRPTCS